MSDRPLDLDLTKHTEVRADKVEFNTNPTTDEIATYRHKLAQVLDRTMTVDRLNVDLPPELSSYWCPNDSLSIAKAELRGYLIDTEFAQRNGLTDMGDGKARIADVVHMIRPKWMTVEERSMEARRYHDTHIRDKRKQKEESDFVANSELPVEVKSKSTEVSGAEIKEALKPEN